MKKTFRVAVLSTVLALCAAPVFADPGGNDPPPPGQKGGSNGTLSPGTTGSIILSILTTVAG
ncbi:MAG TPA: hypothetical protein VHE33_06705 [Acidobacteriaceae bacterium]|jgi:hypothetical protein|nr:hypothetical protein [Acidobacteriaceae bacterium]